MNRLGGLSQIPVPKHGRISQGSGGFNVWSPGVHDKWDGNQKFRPIAGTRTLDPGEKLLWMTWCASHSWIHFSFFFAHVISFVVIFCHFAPARH